MSQEYQITGNMLRDYQYPIARDLVNGKYKFYIGALPRKSGKSLLGFYVANACICLNKDRIQHWLICAKEKSQTNDIYADNILDVGKPLFSILPAGAKYSEYKSRIFYSNGSTIKFDGSDNIETIRGKRYDGIIGDEFATWNDGIFGALYPCLRDENSIFMLYSTVRRRNHFWKKLQELEKNPLWLTQNTNVIELGLMTQEEFDNLPLDLNFKRQEYMNDPDSGDVGAIYSKPNIGNIEILAAKTVYIGVDLGELDDATAFVGAQISNEKINIIFTLSYKGMVSGDVIAELKSEFNKMKININDVILYLPHDSQKRDHLSGLSREQHLRQEGFTCRMVPKKGLVDGIDLVRHYWYQIIFDEKRCEHGIEDIKAYVQDETGRPDTGKANHRYSHVPDGLRYLCIGFENYGIIEAWRLRVKNPMTKYTGMSSYKIGC